VDDILDQGQHSSIVHHDDRPPLAIINRVGLPWEALLTLLSFLCFHAFWDGNPNTIWDANSSMMDF
jgi:hypothetical protein